MTTWVSDCLTDLNNCSDVGMIDEWTFISEFETISFCTSDSDSDVKSYAMIFR
jgi:hypothetical protein